MKKKTVCIFCPYSQALTNDDDLYESCNGQVGNRYDEKQQSTNGTLKGPLGAIGGRYFSVSDKPEPAIGRGVSQIFR